MNCSAEDDGSEVWKLIHDMTCKNPDEMFIPELAERVRYFKDIKGGYREVDRVDELFEEYFKDYIDEATEQGKAKGKADALLTLIKSGVMTLDKIAETFSMSLADVQAIAKSAER